MKLLLLIVATFGLCEAGFRCTIGEFACSASCKVFGQSSGVCDDDNECW